MVLKNFDFVACRTPFEHDESKIRLHLKAPQFLYHIKVYGNADESEIRGMQ